MPNLKATAPSWLFPGIVVLGIALLLFFTARGRGGVAPIPPGFDPARTIAQASQTGKPVLAFVTADWCGPCQAFKRGALADPRVTAALREKVEAVYVDVDKSAEAADLNVMSVPTLLLIRDGKERARVTGAMGTEQMLGWLDAALNK